MDVSLVLLAMKANLSTCDVMYAPCKQTGNDWEVNKCNDKKPPLDIESTKIIMSHVNNSGEQHFYERNLKNFRQEVQNNDLTGAVSDYLRIRDQAELACSTKLSRLAWQNVFFVDAKVKLVFETARLYFSTGAGQHSKISPLWVCMQNYCHDNYKLNANPSSNLRPIT
ncbi:hypothetical protein EB796_020262 [Bugula neritina]|uniref:Uncharacterized protein n=1 Tax=Bugula neritina TaxID=10212 RepID=A0A7J7J6R7_BUGNE|nr:hypothetical protein EB796_020262 [Bugula neritina]